MMTENVRAFDPKHAGIRRVLGRGDEVATDRVYLLFTSFEETLAAIPVASRLAQALRSRLMVIHFKPVAFGAPLEDPCGLSPVETNEFRARLEAEQSDAEARVCVCRDARAALATARADAGDDSVPDENGEYVLITGNEVGVLLLEYLCRTGNDSISVRVRASGVAVDCRHVPGSVGHSLLAKILEQALHLAFVP